jgi:ABC-type antimicrobial peptide transport system permease subunit
MSYDALTIAAIVIVVVLIVVIILIGRSNTNNDRKMRILARHLMMMEGNDEAMKLCQDIHKEYPDLCVGLDFTLRENGDSIEIDEWNSSKPRPRG